MKTEQFKFQDAVDEFYTIGGLSTSTAHWFADKANEAAVVTGGTLTLPAVSAKTWRKAVTSHPDWPAVIKETGVNSGSLTKAMAQVLAVYWGIEKLVGQADQAEDQTDQAEDQTEQAEPTPAKPSQATDQAATVMREIFGALGQGDMDGVRTIIGTLSEAKAKAEAEAATAKTEAAEAARRAAATPRGVTVGQKVNGPAQPIGETTLNDIMPRADRSNLPSRLAKMPLITWDGTAEPDPNFAPDPQALAAMAACDWNGRNVWLYGPAGTGKSSLPQWYAAKLGRPFFRIAFDRSTEPEDLIGGKEPDGQGGMQWADGVLAQAIRTAGAVILLDEPTLARPTALAMLQTLLDDGRQLLARSTGEVIHVAQNVLFVAADNTAGTGDETGQYSGTSAMNRAFLDRMAARIEVGYMDPAREAEVLHRRTGLAKPACKRLVDFARRTRDAVKNGDMAHALGMRRLMAWAELVATGLPSQAAFGMTCLAGEAPDDAEAVMQMANAHLDHGAIDKEA